MASPTGSVKNGSTEKSSSKDNKNDKIGVDEEHIFSPNPDHAETLSSRFPGINLVVDLPVYGPIYDQAPKCEQEKVLEDKAKKEAATAKAQEEAQVQKNIQAMAKRLRAVFGDGSRPYKPRKRLCDVFGDVPGDVPGDAPGDALGDVPGDVPDDAPGDVPSDVSGEELRVFGDAPGYVPDEESCVSSDEEFISSDEFTSHPPN